MAIAKKKKKFIDVEIPLIGKTIQLYEYDVNGLDNKFIKFDLTRTLRGKNMVLKLRTKVLDDKVTTIPKEIKLLPCYLKRMVRKGTNYVEDSFVTPCSDAQIRVKPFLITRRKVSRAVRKALRDRAREEIVNYFKDKTAEEIIDDILKNKFQKHLSLILKKIYPLSLCEIRVLKIEDFKE